MIYLPLAQNSQRLNKVMAGLENLTGSGDNRGEIAQAAEAIRKLAESAGLLGPWRPTSSGALSPSVVATSLPRSNWSLLGDWSHWASAAPRRRPPRDHHLGRRQCRAAAHKRAGCWARDEADIAA
jgi:thioesterase domain-containing protein